MTSSLLIESIQNTLAAFPAPQQTSNVFNAALTVIINSDPLPLNDKCTSDPREELSVAVLYSKNISLDPLLYFKTHDIS